MWEKTKEKAWVVSTVLPLFVCGGVSKMQLCASYICTAMSLDCLPLSVQHTVYTYSLQEFTRTFSSLLFFMAKTCVFQVHTPPAVFSIDFRGHRSTEGYGIFIHRCIASSKGLNLKMELTPWLIEPLGWAVLSHIYWWKNTTDWN